MGNEQLIPMRVSRQTHRRLQNREAGLWRSAREALRHAECLGALHSFAGEDGEQGARAGA
jgi:hypothetical protein